MGFLSLFSKDSPVVPRLPAGSMTIDREGRVLVTTVPSACSPELLEEIGKQVLRLFREAGAAQVPLSELTLRFAGLKLVAREMQGGAIIFLTPKD